MPQQNEVGELGANASNFIRSIMASDVETGRARVVVTRFPPEPNGFLHPPLVQSRRRSPPRRAGCHFIRPN